jgi:hypothetical protein
MTKNIFLRTNVAAASVSILDFRSGRPRSSEGSRALNVLDGLWGRFLERA